MPGSRISTKEFEKEGEQIIKKVYIDFLEKRMFYKKNMIYCQYYQK